jgi:toxin HigB-1
MLYSGPVEVYYADRRLADVCANERLMKREHGPKRAKRLAARLQQLRLADTLADMRLVTARIHELSGDRAGCIALDLDGPYRLVIEPVDWVTDGTGRLDWTAVTAVVVLEVVDYH